MAFDPELHAILSEGDNADTWQPFMDKPKIPTYEGIKSIRKYFPQFSGIPYQPNQHVFPAHFYHPDGRTMLIRDKYTSEDPPRLEKSAKEQAKALGIEYRQSTFEEKAQGFPEFRWVFGADCKWRTIPFEAHTKFDPVNVQHSKTVVYPQHQSGGGGVSAEQIAAIVSAVASQFEERAARNGKASLATDPEFAEYQQFKQWLASKEVQETVPQAKEVADILDKEVSELNSLIAPVATNEVVIGGTEAAEADVKQALIDEARKRGIKVDGRWSMQRLQTEIEKVVNG